MQKPIQLEFAPEEIDALFERLDSQKLKKEDYAFLGKVIQAAIWLRQVLEDEEISVKSLKTIFNINTKSAKKMTTMMVGISENKSE